MFVKKLMVGLLSLAMVASVCPNLVQPATEIKAASSQKEITLDKTEYLNPIGGYDTDGNMIYGGDPSVLVDGDTVYLYVGHDTSTGDSYLMPEWMCYSTKDLKNWTYEGVIMGADKKSVTWANTGTDAWAGQVMKYNNKYYFYYCTWDSTASGKQSIGVAVSDSPTGGFKDIGQPLVKGTVTTGESSTWNDIDPTAWIETDSKGVEHRYLSWGNGKVFVCELNEDMISVKDVNGDGNITFGTQAAGKTSADVDIIEKDVSKLSFTEAPWIYRRQDSEGKYTGDYYLFYATGWREGLGYATTDDLMDGAFSASTYLMAPTTTSNTNHPAIFDFKGKTYMIYHNGSMPGGSGFRRSPCIVELNFNEDGSLDKMEETAVGINGKTSLLYSYDGSLVSHEKFTNSSTDDSYPYVNVSVGAYSTSADFNAKWAISAGKADASKDSYVSIQSENKPGLYITANDDGSVSLAQDYDFTAKAETAKKQTFKTVEGLADSKGVSFESLSQEGKYLTMVNGKLYLSSGSKAKAATFYQDEEPSNSGSSAGASTNDLKGISVEGTACDISGSECTVNVACDKKTVAAKIETSDSKGAVVINDSILVDDDGTVNLSASSFSTEYTIKVFAEDGSLTKTMTLKLEKDYSTYVFGKDPVLSFTFEDESGLSAVTKGLPPAEVDPAYFITEDNAVCGASLYLPGSQGVDLGSANKLGNSYSISFWVMPSKVNSNVDPVFAAGTFTPEYWLNLTCDAKIWSKHSNYYATTAANVYKAGEWNHILLTVDGDTAGTAAGTVNGKLYVNGALVSEGDVADKIMTQSAARLYLGVNGWDAYLQGYYDEVLCFDRVLSDEDIQVLSSNLVNSQYFEERAKAASTSATATPTPSTSGASSTSNTSTTSSTSNSSLKKATIKVKKGKKAVKKVTIKKGKKVTLKVSVNSKAKLSMKKLTKKQKKIAKVTFKSNKLKIKAKKKGSFKIKLTAKKTSTYKKATKTIKVKVK
ncbi:MAG: family 43 glycosylhydrolase [Eubacterium sp.]|nr:family 43 glycosylhydrolase [Eubacterium sp.]